MDGIVWTGTGFLLVENTVNNVWSAPPAGSPLQLYASMPNLVEETRCALSPGTHGFPTGALFCHSPDDKIYEIGPGGSSASVFATLPAPAGTVSDGALAFDSVGKFGYQLVAATGRSGVGQPPGGVVYTIGANGAVNEVGPYSGPAGADELIIAPASFGSVGGDALLTLDAGAGGGLLVAMDPSAATRTVLQTHDGLNPIAFIPPAASGRPSSGAGLYVTNDTSPFLYYAPASELSRYGGDIIVGSENTAHFWAVAPHGSSFVSTRIRHSLRGGDYSLEQAVYLQ
jgi:hypothetical protein